MKKRIEDIVNTAVNWIMASEVRSTIAGIGVVVIIIGLPFFWLVGGFPTGQFYIGYSSGGKDLGIYHEYFLGKDPKIEWCFQGMDACLEELETLNSEWAKYQKYEKGR